jgi:hypothetical protein
MKVNLKVLLALTAFEILSAASFAKGKGPDFSIVCKTVGDANSPTISYVGSAVKKGKVFHRWDLTGTLVYSDAATNTRIQLAIEEPGILSDRQVGLDSQTVASPDNTANREARVFIWLPQTPSQMPASLEFTSGSSSENNIITIVDAETHAKIYDNSAVQIQCAWTKVHAVKPSWFESTTDSFGNAVGNSLFGGNN